jgi:hypothetical protein
MPCLSLPRSRADQGIRRGAPFSGGLLSGQDEATGARARKLHEASRHELAVVPNAVRGTDLVGTNPLAQETTVFRNPPHGGSLRLMGDVKVSAFSISFVLTYRSKSR